MRLILQGLPVIPRLRWNPVAGLGTGSAGKAQEFFPEPRGQASVDTLRHRGPVDRSGALPPLELPAPPSKEPDL
jgi:hypothetical protein